MSKILNKDTKAQSLAQSAPPKIFDMDARRQRRARAARRYEKTGQLGFFTQRCAEDTAERLMDIAQTFENALIIAPNGFQSALLAALPQAKHPKNILSCYDLDAKASSGDIKTFAADDTLPFKPQQFDLVISILSLHSVNDLPGALVNIHRCLKADGLMLSALFGGQTLTEFRQSFYAAETQILGSPVPRIFPMIDFSQAAALLQRTGFALPVVDTDRMHVNYSSFDRLIADLRDQGETNILTSRSHRPMTKKLRTALIESYQNLYGTIDSKLPATFEVLWLTGWAPHARQQKPLKPGSAKMRLADALGAKEQKLSF